MKKEYKESQQFKNISLQMLSDLEEIAEHNKKFDVCLDTLAQAVINPLKISYIKKSKIVGLIENAGIVIADKPTTEQREKYFSCCSLMKFANHFFKGAELSENELNTFNEIVQKATAEINNSLDRSLHILESDRIPEIYSLENNKGKAYIDGKEYTISIDGSCMQGKPEKYFEIYNSIDKSKNMLKMAVLTQGQEIIARSLIWINASNIDRRKPQDPELFYIDRIYTKTQTHRLATQKQLVLDVIKYFHIKEELDNNTLKLPDMYNRHHISDELYKHYQAQLPEIDTLRFNSYCYFEVHTKKDYYDYYPYLDSLQHFNTYQGYLTQDEDSDCIKLDSTCGEYSNTGRDCENCGCTIHEEDSIYIDTEDIYACEDCAVFCDERDESILRDEAVYNNFTGCYHYRPDLDC